MTKKKIIIGLCIAIVGTVALVACGGGSGSSSTTATSTRNLPPDPGSAANATLAGVDINNNGVRDEVERDLSSHIKDDAAYALALKSAAISQASLVNPPTTRQQALQELSDMICVANGKAIYGDSTNYIEKQTFNTSDRASVLNKSNKLLNGGVDGEELPPCK